MEDPKPNIEPPYQFQTVCPLCDEMLIAEGKTSSVIVDRKVEHLKNEHKTEELEKHYYARQIAEKDSK